MSDELQDLFMADDAEQREARTKRHEAGHAGAAWIIRDDLQRPPFDWIEIGTMAEHASGVVPGGVHFDAPWFESLSPVERGTILLAGIYMQDGDEGYDSHAWRDALNAVEGADGTDDYARAMEVADDAGVPRHEFDEQVRVALQGMRIELGVFVDVTASTLVAGQRTTSATIVAAVTAALAKAQVHARTVGKGNA
jgi:hypothetical protein